MSTVGVKLKINVSKIEKERLFPGKKGKYLDATVFINLDEQDPYGNNGMITQDVSKEEREQGVKGPILGNCEVFYRDNPQSLRDTQTEPQEQPQAQGGGFDDFDDDIDW